MRIKEQKKSYRVLLNLREGGRLHSRKDGFNNCCLCKPQQCNVILRPMLHRIRDGADGDEVDKARLKVKVWEMGETQQLHDDGPGGPLGGGAALVSGGRGLRECWKCLNSPLKPWSEGDPLGSFLAWGRHGASQYGIGTMMII